MVSAPYREEPVVHAPFEKTCSNQTPPPSPLRWNPPTPTFAMPACVSHLEVAQTPTVNNQEDC